MPTNASDDVNFINDTEKSRGKSTRATPADAVIITSTTAAKPPISVDKKKKKRSGSFGIFKAALLMFRGRPAEKKAKRSIARQNSVAPNGDWTDLVGSVRPLHLNKIDQSPPPSISPDSTPPSEKLRNITAERIEDFTTTPASPTSPAWSASRATSHYASASSLRDLIDSSDDDEDDPDEVFDAITGDEMIDSKAEEFIAQFYKQIQLQNTAVIHHQRQRTI